MGGNLDESLLSTASTLIDSCSTSLNVSFDDAVVDQVDKAKENNGIKPFLCHGKLASFATGRTNTNSKKGNWKIASPTTTIIDLEINVSATDRSERTTASKLDRLRAKTKLLRNQGAQKIEETRTSLRKSRMISFESPPSSHPPLYPPPSLHNKATAARTKHENSEPTRDLKDVHEVKLSDFLRHSNSVIDRLSSEIAMAGSIINQSTSYDVDTTFNDMTVNKTSDFASNINIYAEIDHRDIGNDQMSIHNEDNSIHNISIGEGWDQSTISATLPGSHSTLSPEPRENSTDAPPPRPFSNSGLPPPEVVVKIITPRDIPRVDLRAAEVSFSETESSTFAPRATVEDRHRRQRPPSISPSQGGCASMYNTNQKCEKLAMENDCLKRQLDLLESRHRDSQRKLTKELSRQGDQEVQEEDQQPATITSLTIKTSKSNTYGYHRKKKKRSDRRRIVVLLLLATFLISSALWLYRSIPNASLSKTNASSAANGIGLASMMREGVVRQTLFGETVFSDNSSDIKNEDNCMIDDLDHEPDNLLVLHEPPTKYREFDSAKHDESSSSKKASRFKRFVSRINFRHDLNPMGVWLKKHQQITTKKNHAEL